MAQIKYGKTLLLSNLANFKAEYFKAGQWVSDVNTGVRGQYLGVTTEGVIVIRWQHGKFGRLADTKSNKYLRQFARVNGAK
jgi:hypothetical protein